MKELDHLSSTSERLAQANENELAEVQPSTNSSLTVGNLEPSLDLLELLLSSDAIQGNVDLLIDKEPVASLFDLELAASNPSTSRGESTQCPPKDPASK